MLGIVQRLECLHESAIKNDDATRTMRGCKELGNIRQTWLPGYDNSTWHLWLNHEAMNKASSFNVEQDQFHTNISCQEKILGFIYVMNLNTCLLKLELHEITRGLM